MLTRALRRATAWLGSACLIVALGFPGGAHAATFDVTRFDDPDPTLNPCISGINCSLRAAVLSANSGGGGDTLVLPAGEYRLTIPGLDASGQKGDLDVTKSTTIQGPNARTTTIRQTVGDRVFEIHAGGPSISGVTITGGNPDPPINTGGGIAAQGGTGLTLTNVAVSGNTMSGPASMSTVGGGIFADNAQVTVANSTVSGNTVGTTANNGTGGGVFTNSGKFTITNSTISGNTANGMNGGTGGGINSTGDITLLNVTLNGNTAAGANGKGGNFNHGINTATLKNTIVSNGTASTKPNCQFVATFTSQGHNLEDRNECNFTAAGDQINTNPLLGPLANNGGGTDTQALASNSPAVDRASPDCPPPTIDQRGVSRPQLTACDVGAFEFQPLAVAGANGGSGGGGGRGPVVTGIGGSGGSGGLCGGGGAGAGGVGAGGGGAGGGGCFSVPLVQRLSAGQVVAFVDLLQSGSTVRADALVDARTMRRAGPARLQLIGSTTKRRVPTGRIKLVVRLGAKARKQLRRLRRLRVTLRLSITSSGGRRLSTTRMVTLRR